MTSLSLHWCRDAICFRFVCEMRACCMNCLCPSIQFEKAVAWPINHLRNIITLFSTIRTYERYCIANFIVLVFIFCCSILFLFLRDRTVERKSRSANHKHTTYAHTWASRSFIVLPFTFQICLPCFDSSRVCVRRAHILRFRTGQIWFKNQLKKRKKFSKFLQFG